MLRSGHESLGQTSTRAAANGNVNSLNSLNSPFAPLASYADSVTIPGKQRAQSLGFEANQRANEGDFYGAAEKFTEAIDHDKSDSRFYLNRSYCYAMMSLFQLALDDAQQAIDLNPTEAKCHFRKGHALVGLKKYWEAERAFMDCLRREPNCKETKQELFKVRYNGLTAIGFGGEAAALAAARYDSLDEARSALQAELAKINAHKASKAPLTANAFNTNPRPPPNAPDAPQLEPSVTNVWANAPTRAAWDSSLQQSLCNSWNNFGISVEPTAPPSSTAVTRPSLINQNGVGDVTFGIGSLELSNSAANSSELGTFDVSPSNNRHHVGNGFELSNNLISAPLNGRPSAVGEIGSGQSKLGLTRNGDKTANIITNNNALNLENVVGGQLQQSNGSVVNREPHKSNALATSNIASSNIATSNIATSNMLQDAPTPRHVLAHHGGSPLGLQQESNGHSLNGSLASSFGNDSDKSNTFNVAARETYSAFGYNFGDAVRTPPPTTPSNGTVGNALSNSVSGSSSNFNEPSISPGASLTSSDSDSLIASSNNGRDNYQSHKTTSTTNGGGTFSYSDMVKRATAKYSDGDAADNAHNHTTNKNKVVNAWHKNDQNGSANQEIRKNADDKNTKINSASNPASNSAALLAARRPTNLWVCHCSLVCSQITIFASLFELLTRTRFSSPSAFHYLPLSSTASRATGVCVSRT